MYQKAKTFTLARPRLRKFVGWAFMVIGVIALIAPVIPGAPLIFVGFELLGFRLLFVDKLLGREPRLKQETP